MSHSYETEKFRNGVGCIGIIGKGVLCAAVIIGASFGMKVYAMDGLPSKPTITLKECSAADTANLDPRYIGMTDDKIMQAILDRMEGGYRVSLCSLSNGSFRAFRVANEYRVIYGGKVAHRAIRAIDS